MDKPKITVVMIVKNEAHVIETALKSVKDAADNWVIIDNGSTDKTLEIIEKLSKDSSFPGKIYNGIFENFSQSRNSALEKAEAEADWIITLDADMEWIDSRTLRKEIFDCHFNKQEIDGILVKNVENGKAYWQVRAFRVDRGWRYKYRTHEILTKGLRFDQEETPILVDSKSFTKHYATGGSRSDKYERDIRLLLEEIEESPDDAVPYFYLAQTYEAVAQYKEAVRCFRKVIALDKPENSQLIYLSMIDLGWIFRKLGYSEDAVVQQYLEAASLRPGRFEAKLIVYKFLNSQLKFQTILELEELFNQDKTGSDDKMLYSHRDEALCKLEVAKALFAVKDLSSLQKLKKELFKNSNVSKDEIDFLNSLK